MILLQGHSISPLKKIPLETMSLQLKERDSTASIVPADMDGITVNSWMVDDTGPGKGIVWRVKSISQAYATRTPTVQLEHAINTLKDRILFGEHKPKDITGNNKATTCTADQAIRYILSYQSDWVLGTFGYNVSNPYKFDGDSLFDALETITASLPNACWTYDMNVYPFRLNIVNKDSTVGSELRAGRNLKTITKTIDKSSMYTRFYPIGKDDLHIDGNYVERNANVYGVIEKVETDASIDSEAELRRWADERLDLHAEPNVTIDVEGFELANATGESIDRMTLGRACRVPLPEYGTTIQERIVTLTYQDKIHQPEVFKATLANNREDITKIIADNMKKGGKSGRTSTKQAKEDHAWFEDTNNHVAMCAIGIIGTDAEGNPNWTRLSTLEVNENGIYGEVKSVQGDLVIAETRIDMNENAISLEAKRAQTAEGTLSGKITVEAGKITQIVSAVGYDGQVTAASICLAINNGGSTATINADKIYLLGQTIANTISANYISAQLATLAQVTVNGLNVIGDAYVRNGAGSQQNVSAAIWDIQLSGPVNNVYTLKRRRINESDYTDIGTFSRATSLSAGWDGNRTFTVSASPQGVSRYTTLFSSVPDSDVSWSNGVGTLTLKATMDGGETSYTVGAVTVNAPNAPTDIGIYDSVARKVSSQTLSLGQAINLWGGCSYGGAMQWGEKVTITAPSDPHPTQYTLKCTDAENQSGSVLYTFKVELTGASFAKGSNYNFYR